MLDIANSFSHSLRSDAIGDDEWSFFLSYNQTQLSPSVPKNSSRMILQDFEPFPKGFDSNYDSYGLSKQINCTFANWCFISCSLTTQNIMKCLFYYKYLSQLQTESILKRSAGKRLSEPGRYKAHSHNFLIIRKFWILSILNTDRSCKNVCFKYTRYTFR